MRKQYDYMEAVANPDNWVEHAPGEYPAVKRILRRLAREAVLNVTTATPGRMLGEAERIAKELIP